MQLDTTELKNSYPLEQEFVQQTFLGASIMDFSVNLGLNSSSSTLSVRLVEDDLNYGTALRSNNLRDAVTEGYHAWNRKAWPKRLTDNQDFTADWPLAAQDGRYPNYGVLPESLSLTGSNYSGVTLDTNTALGDIFYPPETGSPVYFKYFMPSDLDSTCVEQEARFSSASIDPNEFGECRDATGLLVYVEDASLGANQATCEAAGGTWNAATSKCERPAKRNECGNNNWVEYTLGQGCKSVFEFNGIFKKFERTQSSSGTVYNVEVVDPRIILENMTVVLKDLASKTAPNNPFLIDQPGQGERSWELGFDGMTNILNVFGYYEASGFGNSKVNESGMIWNDPSKKIVDVKTEYSQVGFGIFPALNNMLNNFYFRNENGILVSDYIKNGEPFGGPPTYGIDYRINQEEFPPYSHRNLERVQFNNNFASVGLHRYKVDLTDLATLAEDSETQNAYCQDITVSPPVGALDDFGEPLQAKDCTDTLKYRWVSAARGGILPADFRINADKITLLSLIEEVCNTANVDFYVALEKPKRSFYENTGLLDIEERYSGVIKVKIITRNNSLVVPAYDLAGKIKNKNYLSLAIDMATDKEDPQGPFTTPLLNDPTQRQSILSSAELGYEHGEPVTGAIMYGSRYSRVVGVNSIGDRRKYNSVQTRTPFGQGFAGIDDRRYGYLPYIEVDGVQLRHNDFISDSFSELDNEEAVNPAHIDKDGHTWNDYGYEYKLAGTCTDPQFDDDEAGCTGANEVFSPTGHVLDPSIYRNYDYHRTGPQYSNDNFFPFHIPKDYKTDLNEFDPDQLNRVNSKAIEDYAANAGTCTGPFLDKRSCELHGDCLIGGTTTTETKADCDKKTGTYTPYIWTQDPEEQRSGYLDIYPCWGFEQRTVVSNKYSASFDDIIDIKVEEKPIKGMFWDDDPYRDFHPTDGIFSTIEFYNPGLGVCIDENCAIPTGGTFNAKCFENDPVKGISTKTNNKTTEGDCESDQKGRGTCSVTIQLSTPLAPVPPNTVSTDVGKAECDAVNGTWTYDGVWIDSVDELNSEFSGTSNIGKACHVVGGESEQPIPEFKNKMYACQCDPLAQVGPNEVSVLVDDLDECAKSHQRAGLDSGWKANLAGGGQYEYDPVQTLPRKRWVSHCQTSSICTATTAGGGKIRIGSLHEDELGVNNTFHEIENVCEMGCFEQGQTKPVVAFHKIDSPNGTGKKKGDKATIDQTEDWTEGNIATNGSNKYVQIILDKSTCDEYASINGIQTTYVEINIDGEKAAAGEENEHTTENGPYTAQCQAISFYAPLKTGCIKKNGDSSVINNWVEHSPEHLTLEECINDPDPNIEWKQYLPDEMGTEINDFFYGKIVPVEDSAQPGFVSPRYRLKSGKCVEFDNQGNVIPPQIGALPADPTYRPNITRHDKYNPPQDCYAASGGSGSVDYTDDQFGLMNMWVPRTATIPIYIDGYYGNSNEVGGVLNKFNERVAAYDVEEDTFNYYYMATVTELRHAAVSFESWKNYIKSFAPHLPCWMYEQNPVFNSAWRDLCPALSLNVRLGIGSAATDTLINAAVQLDGGSGTLTSSQDAVVGSKSRAEKYTGLGLPKHGDLNIYEQTKMELDRAYQAVRNVAVNFYGRKFLVPLPIIPPAKEYCTGFDDELDPNNANRIIKRRRHISRQECEDFGFQWGAHADLGKMLDSTGLEDISNWEIVEAAWPGADLIDFSTEISADSFPTNLNFWNDDGNLRAFAVFPSTFPNRINEHSQTASFENFDPEQVQITEHPILRDLQRSKHPELKNIANEFGGKVYIEIDVNPKIHWLDDVSLHENVMGHNYFMNEAGNSEVSGLGTFDHREDSTGTPITRTAANASVNLPAFAKFGTKNEKSDNNRISDRAIYKRGNIHGNEIQTNAIGGPVKVSKSDLNSSFAKRPYALITLPEKVEYSINDIADKEIEIGQSRNDDISHRQWFEVPLTETINTKEIFKSWTGHQYLNLTALSDHVALTASANWLAGRYHNPHGGIDVDRMSMVAAAMKPWHAGIPQESNHYRWGPWAFGEGMGKVKADIDSSYSPGVFGGIEPLDNAAFSNVRNKVQVDENNALMVRMSYETGSVTLASGPEHKLGSQPDFSFPANYKNQQIPPMAELAPYVTDISVSVSTNGITTRYGFNTQATFGDIGKIYENRIRDTQRDSLRQFKKQENDLRRTKRTIRDYRDT